MWMMGSASNHPSASRSSHQASQPPQDRPAVEIGALFGGMATKQGAFMPCHACNICALQTALQGSARAVLTYQPETLNLLKMNVARPFTTI